MAYIAIGASVLMRRGFQDFRMIAPPFAKCSTTTLPITLPRCAMSIDCTPACSPICPVASRVDTEAMLAVLLAIAAKNEASRKKFGPSCCDKSRIGKISRRLMPSFTASATWKGESILSFFESEAPMMLSENAKKKASVVSNGMINTGIE